jgi:hypothetical protein
MNFIDWIGVIGVFQILLAYVLNLIGKIEKSDLNYILLNLIGAAMSLIASFLIDYIPFIILEGVWTIVTLISLINYIKLASR